ncbi:hypothetical protein [Streptomyces triticisoli]|uniref:hypothetical protein n=1 Tax=Streptomyces triticisoli TaxID=2182797 RepID=UPI0013008D15|nr:hypothetical protein [Streptomyces triticisoli]
MGLSITVGLLDGLARNDAEGLAYHRGAFARLTEALADNGIDWHEPEISDPPADPAVSTGFPYGYLMHLRQIDDEATMLDSHLLCHSDCSGYYIPVDLDGPLFLPPEADVEGHGMVGSSQGLLTELVGVAPSLGIHLDADGTLSAAEETKLAELPLDAPFEMEKFTWHQLYRACRASIAGGRAIVFQ